MAGKLNDQFPNQLPVIFTWLGDAHFSTQLVLLHAASEVDGAAVHSGVPINLAPLCSPPPLRPSRTITPPAMYSPRKSWAVPPMTTIGFFSWYSFIWMPVR